MDEINTQKIMDDRFLALIPSPQQVLQFDNTEFCSHCFGDISFYAESTDVRLTNAIKACFTDATINFFSNKKGFVVCSKACTGLLTENTPVQQDGYYLSVETDAVYLSAYTMEGLFYGLQTIQKLMNTNQNRLPVCKIKDWADAAIRSEYLEFRNYYPKFENVLLYLKRMAQNHINTLIIEFEDKRPFPTMPFLQDASHGFTKEAIDQLCLAAHKLFIQIIPLQQCFGHIEYVLRHEQFRNVREQYNAPGEMCPLKPESVTLGRMLIRDIVELFPESKYIHLGCDEVWNLGTCDTCKQSGLTKPQLFISFINEMIDEAVSLGKTPLFWQDMLNGCTAEDLRELNPRAIVVVWMYNASDLQFRAKKMVDAFSSCNLEVWGACSIRCWDASGDQNYPVLHKRKQNIKSWAMVAQSRSLKGMVNTNWSAYSALAAPYGVYETSFYPGAFAAACAWNHKESEDGFLQKYLVLFEQVKLSAAFNAEGWQFEDYYEILSRHPEMFLDDNAFAKLMQTVSQYEHAAKTEPGVALQMFRVVIYPDSTMEWESLYGRYQQTLQELSAVKQELKSALSVYLTCDKVDEYICSRYYIWETVEREVLRLAQGQSFVSFEKILSN